MQTVFTSHLSLTGACVRFSERVIFQDLSFNVQKGETLAILGPNGRGKTTLLKALLGSQRLDQGQRQVPHLIGYVPQYQYGSENHCCLDVVLMAFVGFAIRWKIQTEQRKTDLAIAQEQVRRQQKRLKEIHILHDSIAGAMTYAILLCRKKSANSHPNADGSGIR